MINEAVKLGARKKSACDYFNISIRTLQRWENLGTKDKRKDCKKTVPNKLTDAEKKKIIEICCSEQFMNSTPYSIVPILAENGEYYASESTFYRILREANLLKHRKNSRQARKSDKIELKATKPNQIWSWDITYLKTDARGRFYYLYMFVDIWSRMISGWEICEYESGEKAAEMMNRICSKQNIKSSQLTLHSDNGSPMKSGTMLATLEILGVTASFSRPSVSNDNSYSESLFKTLKYTAGYPKHFKSIDEANIWVAKFVEWYNCSHRHSKIGFVTPNQRHFGLDIEILNKRQSIYDEAKIKHPERWAKPTRRWIHYKEVILKKGNYNKVS